MPDVQPQDDGRKSSVRRALSDGMLLTIAQIVFAVFVGAATAPTPGVSTREVAKSYVNLGDKWDAKWFRSIVDLGYRKDVALQEGKRGNVAFFPAYPLLASGLQQITGWDPIVCLLAVAQLATWGFWTYFLLVLQRHGVSKNAARFAAVFVMALPGSFFLVAGYSESLFLFSLFGYVYWTESDDAAARWIGALHGALMTATQIIGFPLALYPLLRACVVDRRIERIFDGLVISIFALLGGIAFFGYCHWRFDAWDIYVTSQAIGWKVEPTYLALVTSDTYAIDLELWRRGGTWNPDWVSRISVPILVVVFLVLAAVETYAALTSPSGTLGDRIPLYLAAAGAFFLVTAGLYSLEYRSVLRKTLCCEALLVVHVAGLVSNEESEDERWGVPIFAALVALLIVLAFVLQGYYVYRFLNGTSKVDDWVA